MPDSTKIVVGLLLGFALLALFFALVLTGISTANVTKDPQKAKDYGIGTAILQAGAFVIIIMSLIVFFVMTKSDSFFNKEVVGNYTGGVFG
jgi:cell division protein FtsW (lipid II flippase)